MKNIPLELVCDSNNLSFSYIYITHNIKYIHLKLCIDICYCTFNSTRKSNV
jgi:hypothetical protein